MSEDLSVFFGGLDSQVVVFTTTSGSKSVKGFFDNAFFDTSVGETVLDTTAPRFTCIQSEIVGVKENRDRVVIAGKTWKIDRIQPEGTGLCTVILGEVTQ